MSASLDSLIESSTSAISQKNGEPGDDFWIVAIVVLLLDFALLIALYCHKRMAEMRKRRIIRDLEANTKPGGNLPTGPTYLEHQILVM
ncbi:hypothetical protein QR680_000554 [Steinernema hermaphroditum]|uniref:Uncharacterized protein n=1 Tax=Steinernema hermaphroditum TaxID=289476 RepID=A0AA39LEH1_9BILA|nr:hypothetical protein QR680_000554 [Steinernema hermaphroditum]